MLRDSTGLPGMSAGAGRTPGAAVDAASASPAGAEIVETLVSDTPVAPWDRRPAEPARAYDAFRRFRDLGPLRTLDDVISTPKMATLVRGWASEQDWSDRAEAWDDECHRIEDAQRLEAIREMHAFHREAGREVAEIALERLRECDPRDLPPGVAVRLLELGARLERDTLTVSVEELQGIETASPDDPWEIVARELDGMPST